MKKLYSILIDTCLNENDPNYTDVLLFTSKKYARKAYNQIIKSIRHSADSKYFYKSGKLKPHCELYSFRGDASHDLPFTRLPFWQVYNTYNDTYCKIEIQKSTLNDFERAQVIATIIE